MESNGDWSLVRNFQFKKYPKISCSAGILPANNTMTGKILLDHFFVEFSNGKILCNNWAQGLRPY